MKTLSVFLLFVFFTVGLCHAFPRVETGSVLSGSVSGVILDRLTQQPVEYANIVLHNQKDSAIVAGTLSTAEGRFLFKNVKEGNYYLVAYFIGYRKEVVKDLVITKNTRDVVVEPIQIEPVSKQLNEVSVTAEKNAVEYKIDKKVVNVAQNLNNTGGTAVDALRNVPGVNIDNSGNVTVRGSSSFAVLVDGKPTVLDGSEALKQIPASSIDKIEVITNPSAKYDAEGTSGIVNILMKKGSNVGLNGVVNASVGTNDKYTSDFLVNFKRQKINYFCGINYRNTNNIGYQDTYKESTVRKDTVDYLESRNRRDMIYRSYVAKGGFDFNINSRNAVSFSGQLGRVDFDGYSNTKYHIWANPEHINQYSLNNEHMQVFGKYYLANLSYSRKFKKEGHELKAVIFYSVWDGNRNESNQEYAASGEWEHQDFLTDENKRTREETKKEFRIKFDYTLPLDSSSKLEAGYQTNLKPIDSEQRYALRNVSNGTWAENPAYRDNLAFYINIHSFYSTYTGKIGDFEYQAGLRAEYTDRVLDQRIMDKKYDYRKLDLFPSGSVSRQFRNNNQLQFSYSRRINRPNEQFLNPLPMYSDKYTAMVGNPELLPEYIDSYELNYMKRFKKGYYSIETYFRQNNNTFNQMIHVNEKGNYYIDFGNIDKTYNIGMDVSGNLDLFKWCSLSPSVSVYGYQYKSDNITYNVPDWPISANANINVNFILNKTTKIQLNGFLNAPYYDVQGWQDYFFYGGISARKDILKKLTAVVNFYNPFGVYQYHSENKAPNLYNTFHMYNEASGVVFSLSYKINNYKPVRRSEDQVDLNIN